MSSRDHETDRETGQAGRVPRQLSEQERQALIEQARRELPALTRQVDESLRRLRQIAAGG